ncbi:SigE family RNA polymerase sigma factor [Kribbella italica]|uniref:RNA polymerase sigma-70 factor (Sigma-E family) n=1 Tax=Kribbella italica TaxID=1540520 RepID=A0A7W9J768_9ACTN|nr:RNA polymerase sigma-70 factor (sigma-E family) [Kribbella italica]
MTSQPGTTGFSEFVAARYDGLLRTAYFLVPDRGLAEDLVQTTLLKCWLVWDTIRADDPSGYVRQVLVNTCRALWRVKKGKQEFPTDQLPVVATPAESAEQLERDFVLVAAVARLPRSMRRAVVLRFLMDLTEVQTAELAGCSVGTIKSQTSRALSRLRLDPSLHDLRRTA